jgi:hypothetical protein
MRDGAQLFGVDAEVIDDTIVTRNRITSPESDCASVAADLDDLAELARHVYV